MPTKDGLKGRLQEERERLERELFHISSMIHGHEDLRKQLLHRQTEAVRMAFSRIESVIDSQPGSDEAPHSRAESPASVDFTIPRDQR
jgi:hypothetical protein